MEIIKHNGKFMRAEPVEARVVAIIWDKGVGGEIIGAADLGMHEDAESVQKAIDAAGFKERRALAVIIGYMSYNFDGETVSPDATIDVYK